jgi:hypothetical protein
MGSTFGALHVKGVDFERAVAWVEASFADRGFERIEETTPEDPGGERRVMVYEAEGWVVIADEEQTHTEDAEDLGRRASDELPGEVIAITVIHSDSAGLRRFRNGARRGGLLVGTPGARQKKLASTKFLADLAVSPEARAELEAGLRADHVFPEDTIYDAAERIGLPNPGVHCSRVWYEPPSGSVAMRFRWPRAEVEPNSDAPGFELDLADGHALLAQSDDLVTGVGEPFREDLYLHLQLQRGSPIKGLGIEIKGPALELLELRKLHGFGSDGTDRVPFEAALERRGDAWFGAFPSAVLTAEAPIEPAAPFGSLASLRQIEHQERRTDQFRIMCEGYAAVAGHAQLVLLPTDSDGTPLDATDVFIEVDVQAVDH